MWHCVCAPLQRRSHSQGTLRESFSKSHALIPFFCQSKSYGNETNRLGVHPAYFQEFLSTPEKNSPNPVF